MLFLINPSHFLPNQNFNKSLFVCVSIKDKNKIQNITFNSVVFVCISEIARRPIAKIQRESVKKKLLEFRRQSNLESVKQCYIQ